MCGADSLEPEPLWASVHFDERTPHALQSWLKSLIFKKGELWRKRFLRFITGSFTLPRGGLARSISIRTQGDKYVDQLPRASTCAFQLSLPPYPSEDVLERKMDVALDNTAGFFIW